MFVKPKDLDGVFNKFVDEVVDEFKEWSTYEEFFLSDLFKCIINIFVQKIKGLNNNKEESKWWLRLFEINNPAQVPDCMFVGYMVKGLWSIEEGFLSPLFCFDDWYSKSENKY